MSPACQVSFYVLADAASSAGHLACRLCSMAWEGGHRVTVLTGDAAESQALDELMWDHPPRITSYNVCYTKLLRISGWSKGHYDRAAIAPRVV